MTRLVNDPVDFPNELVDGFVGAHPRYVRRVFGGVVRATARQAGKVAVITGGGTGHYPGFMGWVGPGLVDGAATGNIFASPSASQAVSVAKAVDQGGGVLIAFLNYAGDVLHFGQAAERLRADGIDARIAVVTDDIASAPASEVRKRRGVAGGLPVLKVTSAAAEAGLSLDEVERVFAKANSRTRSFGVAFSGCTLPGATHPLFEVAPGQMGVGLGVHGEPGIYDADMGTADDVAGLLVDSLLKEKPEGAADRVIVILNGLGSAKYEELFVTFRSVKQRLESAGVEIADSQVGEFMTSLDMGGVSLTLVWPDAELEDYWFAPVDTPAFRHAPLRDAPLPDSVVLTTEPEPLSVRRPGSAASQAAAAQIARALSQVRDVIAANEERLGDLDAIAGDGDHGSGMARGSRGAADAAAWLVNEGAGAQTTLVGAGDRWSESAGGASGALWGAALTAAGNAVGDDAELDAAAQARAIRAFVGSITRLGGAAPGDKTMVDAQVPFAEEFELAVAAGADSATAWARAAAAAEAGAVASAQLVPQMGRSRVLGERSLGSPDPGAVSFALIAGTVAALFASEVGAELD